MSSVEKLFAWKQLNKCTKESRKKNMNERSREREKAKKCEKYWQSAAVAGGICCQIFFAVHYYLPFDGKKFFRFDFFAHQLDGEKCRRRETMWCVSTNYEKYCLHATTDYSTSERR